VYPRAPFVVAPPLGGEAQDGVWMDEHN